MSTITGENPWTPDGRVGQRRGLGEKEPGAEVEVLRSLEIIWRRAPKNSDNESDVLLNKEGKIV